MSDLDTATFDILILASTLIAGIATLVSTFRIAGSAADRQKAVDAKLSSKNSQISAEFTERGGGAKGAKVEEPDS